MGTSSRGRGRLSSVQSGVIDSIDRVRKSSGCIRGAEKCENDRAADLRTRREAVRLDLKDTFRCSEPEVETDERINIPIRIVR